MRNSLLKRDVVCHGEQEHLVSNIMNRRNIINRSLNTSQNNQSAFCGQH